MEELIKELSKLVARDIIQLGGDIIPCYRIEFKSRDERGIETAHGGLNESALAEFLSKSISSHIVLSCK